MNRRPSLWKQKGHGEAEAPAVRATVRDATEAAAWAAGWAAAWAAAALVVRDLISAEHYDELTRVVRDAGFVVHPDDEPLSDES